MKKNKLSLLLLVLLTGALFFSCSDDDDFKDKSDSKISEEIVGTWKRVARSGYEIYNGERDEINKTYSSDFMYYQFDADGTGVETWEDDEEEEYTEIYDFTWTVKDKVLTLTFKWSSGETDYETYKIIDLGSSKLVLEEEDIDGENIWYQKTTFTRVK